MKPTTSDLLAQGTIKKWQDTGPCEIHTSFVVSKWGPLWRLAQWKETFTLMKLKRKDSSIRDLKLEITDVQAKELIKALNLQPLSSKIFSSSTTWLQDS
jgi:hypothetical protein